MADSARLDHSVERLRWKMRTLWASGRVHEAASRPWTSRRLQESLQPRVRRPVFIVGAPRSGTSLLGRCVAALPRVSYHFEPPGIKTAAQHVYDGSWAFEQAREWYVTTYRWLLRARFDGDARLVDKTPRNSFIIPFLLRTFPDARFVHIIRDGCDAAWSHHQKPWMRDALTDSGEEDMGGNPYGARARFWVEPERTAEFESTTTLHRCIWAWRRHVEAVLDAKMRLSPAQYTEVHYEAFVQAPQETADPLLDFLEVFDAEARRAFHDQATEVHTDSVGAGRTALSEEQRRVIDREAGDCLQRLGYAPASSAQESKVS